MTPEVDLAEGGLLVAQPSSQSPSHEGEVLRLTYTLCLSGSTPRAVSAVGYLERSTGRYRNTSLITLPTEEVSNLLRVDPAGCIEISEPIDPIVALVLPSIIEALAALRNAAPDPGWDCIVVGSDSRAELMVSVARWCGVRRLGFVTREREHDHVTGASRLFHGSPSDWQQELSEYLLEDPSPVVVLDTTGDKLVVSALLSALPPHGRLALLGHGTSESTAVDFYRDVHSKNAMIVGNQSLVDSRLVHRALNLFRHRIQPDFRAIPILKRADASTLEVPDGQWMIFDWGQESVSS